MRDSLLLSTGNSYDYHLYLWKINYEKKEITLLKKFNC